MMIPENGFCFEFTVADTPVQFRFASGETTAMEAVLENGALTVSMRFSWREAPLCLRGAAVPGNTARFVYRTYRIELYVDGTIVDEEWPCSEPLHADAVQTVGNTELRALPVPEERELPSFCGSFVGAEGWMPGGGVFAGDCMPYANDGRYHVLYLKDRHHHQSKWGKGAHQWEHLSTTDLIHWDVHPMAVPITSPEEGSICTGSWIADGGKQYLYYTVRTTDGTPAPIRRSVSEDGYHFHKDEDFRFILSERYFGATARDPKVVRGEDGLLHMFVTTTDLTVKRGCLVHLISRDAEHFEECGNIYTAPNENEPECSDYFALNGKYYLIFSHYGKGQYLVSDEPFSGFRAPADPMIPCSSVPKCAVWKGRILFTGFRGIDGYAGTLTFMEAEQQPDGTLTFRNVPETESVER